MKIFRALLVYIAAGLRYKAAENRQAVSDLLERELAAGTPLLHLEHASIGERCNLALEVAGFQDSLALSLDRRLQ